MGEDGDLMFRYRLFIALAIAVLMACFIYLAATCPTAGAVTGDADVTVTRSCGAGWDGHVRITHIRAKGMPCSYARRLALVGLTPRYDCDWRTHRQFYVTCKHDFRPRWAYWHSPE